MWSTTKALSLYIHRVRDALLQIKRKNEPRYHTKSKYKSCLLFYASLICTWLSSVRLYTQISSSSCYAYSQTLPCYADGYDHAKTMQFSKEGFTYSIQYRLSLSTAPSFSLSQLLNLLQRKSHIDPLPPPNIRILI